MRVYVYLSWSFEYIHDFLYLSLSEKLTDK